MERSRVIDTIARGRIVAILRGDFAGREVEIASILYDAGITAVEVTLNSPGAFDAIRKIADRLGTNVAVGAGTVLRRSGSRTSRDERGLFHRVAKQRCSCHRGYAQPRPRINPRMFHAL